DLHRSPVVLQRRHFRLKSQRRLRRVDLQLVDQVVLFACEEGVRRDRDVDVEVAWLAARRAGVPFAAEAHARAVADAGRDLDAEAARLPLAPGAPALRARVGDDAALSMALRAGADVDELSEEAAADAPHLAGALAGRAARRLRARFAAGAGA